MLRLASSWIWDSWLVDDGERFHLFFLKASRALLDPERRHLRASIGHAVSDDLLTWTELADALVASDPPALDDRATWTGSIVRGDDGQWWMFYTGVGRETAEIQRIFAATSEDLLVWDRVQEKPLVEADPQWYELWDRTRWGDQAWRDPWVFRDPLGDGWHMLVTARSPEGDADGAGVIGHAISPDMLSWSVRPPLSRPGSGFGQLEVLQHAVVDGRGVLVFSCGADELSRDRRGVGVLGGIWAVDVEDPTQPIDIEAAYLLADESLYVGRLIQDRAGQWVMLAFRNRLPDGTFVGEITDPLPVGRGPDGRLRLL